MKLCMIGTGHGGFTSGHRIVGKGSAVTSVDTDHVKKERLGKGELAFSSPGFPTQPSRTSPTAGPLVFRILCIVPRC